MSPEEKKIFDMQSPSYKAAMLQSKEDRLAHKYSPIPKEAQCVKEDGTVDLNVRFISAEEEVKEQGLRRGRGKVIEDRFPEELKTNRVTRSIEIKERAEGAWMGSRTVAYVKKAFGDIMKEINKSYDYVSTVIRIRNDK